MFMGAEVVDGLFVPLNACPRWTCLELTDGFLANNVDTAAKAQGKQQSPLLASHPPLMTHLLRTQRACMLITYAYIYSHLLGNVPNQYQLAQLIPQCNTDALRAHITRWPRQGHQGSVQQTNPTTQTVNYTLPVKTTVLSLRRRVLILLTSVWGTHRDAERSHNATQMPCVPI